MSQVVWRISADTAAYSADDLSGAGAAATGGRWNEKRHAVLYTSTTRALACLETMVHLNANGLPLNRYLVEVTIPDPVWTAAQRETEASLPVGWDAEPASLTSIAFGSRWIISKNSVLLILPSVIVPEESNALINPAHPDAGGVTCRKIRKWLYDPRSQRP